MCDCAFHGLQALERRLEADIRKWSTETIVQSEKQVAPSLGPVSRSCSVASKGRVELATDDSFVGEVLQAGFPLLMLHECDPQRSSCEFERFFQVAAGVALGVREPAGSCI